MPSATPTTTPMQDQPLNRSPRKSHPRVFVTLCGVTIFISLCLYSILVLYPSYQSGIYRSEDPTQENFLVPFYTDDASGLIDSTKPIWTICLVVQLFALFFVPPLSLALLLVLLRKWRLFKQRERLFWISALVLVGAGYILTLPAAVNFGAWVAD
jgi:hypothetical protein